MLPPPLRFLLRSFRLSSSARWLSCLRAAVAVAELFAAATAGDTLRCCFLVSYPALRRLCWSFLVEVFAACFFSRLLVLCILPYHCRLCAWQYPLCITSAASIRRKVYASGRAPRAPTAHRRRQVGMAAKRAGAARRWKNKTQNISIAVV